MSNASVLILVVVIVVLVVMVIKGDLFSCSENYGQDASMRVAAGWVAGPNYGFDPVQIYADQIAKNREYIEQQRKMEGYQPPSNCKACLSTEEFTNSY